MNVSSQSPRLPIERIVSGGQTGVDQGALDAAIAWRIPHGGWCPRGRRSEAGTIPPRYQLKESPRPEYADRTRRNVEDSDATLIVHRGPLQGGTRLTHEIAMAQGKPCFHIDLASETIPLEPLRAWLREHNVRVLNVAGPRESTVPGIAQRTRELLGALFGDADVFPNTPPLPPRAQPP